MAVRFSFYYAAIFLAVGIHLPFWPAWLKFRGLDAAEISLILSVGVWIRAFANPFIAHFADRSGANKKIIMIAAGGGVVTYALFGIADGFWMLFVVNVAASAMFMALIPLGENLASRASVEHGFDYGRVRLWGSITFILAAYAGGWVVEETGDAAILWMIVAAMIAAFIAGFGLPERPTRDPATVPDVRFPAFALLRQKRFLVFIAAVSLLQSSHAVLYVFGTIHWRDAGIADDVIGALWAEGVIAEIILFAFSGAVVARVSPIRLMYISAAAGVVRWAILANTTDLTTLFATQWLHGLTFGAAHLAAMHHMLRTVPERMSASAQGLYSGFAIGLVMGLMMLVTGWLYAGYGGEAFYAMTLLSAAGGAVALWLAGLIHSAGD
jgi:PPP family 3-phenylpropionic acid transporter